MPAAKGSARTPLGPKLKHYSCGRGQFWHYGCTFLTQDALFVVTGSISLSSCYCLSGTSSPTNQNTHRMSQSFLTSDLGVSEWLNWNLKILVFLTIFTNIIFWFIFSLKEQLYKHCCVCVCQSVVPKVCPKFNISHNSCWSILLSCFLQKNEF